ncbi:MAG: hypothetical protein AB1941_03485 [Gemmatimonadota bacterium]
MTSQPGSRVGYACSTSQNSPTWIGGPGEVRCRPLSERQDQHSEGMDDTAAIPGWA